MGLAMLDERISFDVNPSTEMSEEWLRATEGDSAVRGLGISDEDAEEIERVGKARGRFVGHLRQWTL